MNPRGRCYCDYPGECLEETHNNNYQRNRQYGILKSFVFFIVTTLLGEKLTMTVSHICDKFSTNNTIRIMKNDLASVRDHLNSLTIEVKNLINNMQNDVPKVTNDKNNDAILLKYNTNKDDSNIREIIKHEIEKYDADKTGLTDYALESLGGNILTTRDTENYIKCTNILSSIFGLFCNEENNAKNVIQPGVNLGECWAFKGSTGTIVIELITSVYITGLTLEHISSSISPTGETSTAPRDFSFLGLRSVDDKNGFLFGKYKYDNCDSPVQYSSIQNQSNESYEIVEIKFHTNSGNPDYTCIYRIRIHGKLKND